MFKKLATILVFTFLIICAVMFAVPIKENKETKTPVLTPVSIDPNKPDTVISYDTSFNKDGVMIVIEKKVINFR